MSNVDNMDSGGMDSEGIAIIGMTGRFPGAQDIQEFWKNLTAGVESISFFNDDEIKASGIDLASLQDGNYVKARGILKDIELFDAAFFGINPKDAEILDPQQRIFLECAWEALENAGYDPESYQGSIGVYAGMTNNSYYLANIHTRPELIELVGAAQVMMGNEKDYLATRVSYKLNLKGPSVNVYTACSTSLVAVCQAVQGLLSYQCDMALTGGISVTIPQNRGYLYRDEWIGSPDGHTRTFDAKGHGTVFSNGVGIVVLKRLADALADGDSIYAVIKGAALNNDGSAKVSYTAPSVDGQAEAIVMAHAMAGVSAETISYVEAHGTATVLGDPIEFAALTQAFRATTEDKGFCAIGSVKTNIGHLDAAAGMAGLIKTAMALKYRMLPPSLHFEKPNPEIDLVNSPFYVNTKLASWDTDKMPRRAGVSSFGVGGTNAHVVLEEGPLTEPSGPSRPWQLLLLSAKTDSALDAATANLAAHLRKNPQLPLADVAYTLQVGRRAFGRRRMLVCQDSNDAMSALVSADAKRLITASPSHTNPSVVFMFPGQGAQHINMALELYRFEPIFREQVDLCVEFLKPLLDLDLRTVLYPDEGTVEDAQLQLTHTFITQPALFTIEYALAKLWMAWGVQPKAMIGHSIGEYVAACLAGV
ncbi:MAG: type I polyketide synthase, partial [Gammaproteobacteria bacterium]